MGSLIGKQAPVFKAKAVIEGQIVSDFSLVQYQGQYVVFFFYPLDFTFVCPTELHAFQHHIVNFKKRNAQVVACSIDSPYTHLAWLRTTKEKGGIEGVSYPLVSDMKRTIARDFNVFFEEEGIAFRGLFILDREGVIRHQTVNDLPIGRSVEETLRILDALIFSEKHGDVCPADWNVGKQSMKPSFDGLKKYFAISKK